MKKNTEKIRELLYYESLTVLQIASTESPAGPVDVPTSLQRQKLFFKSIRSNLQFLPKKIIYNIAFDQLPSKQAELIIELLSHGHAFFYMTKEGALKPLEDLSRLATILNVHPLPNDQVRAAIAEQTPWNCDHVFILDDFSYLALWEIITHNTLHDWDYYSVDITSILTSSLPEALIEAILRASSGQAIKLSVCHVKDFHQLAKWICKLKARWLFHVNKRFRYDQVPLDAQKILHDALSSIPENQIIAWHNLSNEDLVPRLYVWPFLSCALHLKYLINCDIGHESLAAHFIETCPALKKITFTRDNVVTCITVGAKFCEVITIHANNFAINGLRYLIYKIDPLAIHQIKIVISTFIPEVLLKVLSHFLSHLKNLHELTLGFSLVNDDPVNDCAISRMLPELLSNCNKLAILNVHLSLPFEPKSITNRSEYKPVKLSKLRSLGIFVSNPSQQSKEVAQYLLGMAPNIERLQLQNYCSSIKDSKRKICPIDLTIFTVKYGFFKQLKALHLNACNINSSAQLANYMPNLIGIIFAENSEAGSRVEDHETIFTTENINRLYGVFAHLKYVTGEKPLARGSALKGAYSDCVAALQRAEEHLIRIEREKERARFLSAQPEIGSAQKLSTVPAAYHLMHNGLSKPPAITFTKIFYPVGSQAHPDPAYYRLLCEPNLDVRTFDRSSPLLFIQSTITEAELTEVSYQKLSAGQALTIPEAIDVDEIHQGIATLPLSSQQWYFLPSLVPQDRLLALYDGECPLVVRYSARHEQHVIKLDCRYGLEVFVTLRFYLHSRPTLTLAEVAPGNLQAIQIQKIVDDFAQKFGSDEPAVLDLQGHKKLHPSAYDLVQATLRERKGPCRYRVPAFAQELFNQAIQVARCGFTRNQGHAFVELKLNENTPTVLINLGGAPAKVTILEPHKEQVVQPNVPTTKAAAADETQPLRDSSGASKIRASSQPSRKTAITFQPSIIELKTLEDLEQLLEPGRHLISCHDAQEESIIRMLLQKRMHERALAVLSLPDLIEGVKCRGPRLTIQPDHQAVFSPEAGGVLHTFLTAMSDQTRCLILPCHDTGAVIKTNSIWDDKHAHADETPIPQNSSIIGMQIIHGNTAALEEDLLSRIDQRYRCAIPKPLLHKAYETQVAQNFLLVDTLSVEEKIILPIVDLYHSNEWQKYLLGAWEIGSGFRLKPIVLPARVLLKNLPKHDSFIHFMEQIRLTGRYVYYGRVFDFSPVTFFQEEGYDFKRKINPATKWHHLEAALQATDDGRLLMLNSASLPDFITAYGFGNAEKTYLCSKASYFERAKDATLTCYVTHQLKEDEWAELLDAATQHQCTPHFLLAPGVELPISLQKVIIDQRQASALSLTHLQKITTEVFCVNQIEPAVASLTEIFALRREIAEIDMVNLCHNTPGTVNTQETRFDCQHTESPIVAALKSGETVLLTAHKALSAAQLMQLAPLLLGQIIIFDEIIRYSGKIILITVNTEDECAFLPIVHDQKTLHEPLELPQDRQVLLQASDAPAFAVSALQQATQIAENAEKFQQDVDRKFMQALERNAVNILVGKTGVGKTTQLRRYAASFDLECFFGIDALLNFVEYTGNKRPVLVLEEANTWVTDYTLFFDIAHGTLWVNATPYPFKGNVVFLCNPVNYGNRQLPKLFIQQGAIIELHPLPPEVLYEHSLAPVFKTIDLSEEMQLTIARAWLQLYDFVVQLSAETTRITPRELETIAIIFAARYTKLKETTSDLDVHALALHTAMMVINQLLSDPEKQRIMHCISTSGYDAKSVMAQFPKEPLPNNTEHFIFVPEHQLLLTLLHYLLIGAQYRCQHQLIHLQPMKEFIIEGHSGGGKSELVVAYFESTDHKPPRYLPAQASYSEKKAFLDQALAEGWKVLYNESNLSAEDEALLLFYLSDFDTQGKKYCSSFFLVGTQNSASSFSNRYHAHSNATERRSLSCAWPEYSSESIGIILREKNYTSEQIAYAVHLGCSNLRILAKILAQPIDFKKILEGLVAPGSGEASAEAASEQDPSLPAPKKEVIVADGGAPARQALFQAPAPAPEPAAQQVMVHQVLAKNPMTLGSP